jgi:drug/metabolite transporter (DMT)-like permease
VFSTSAAYERITDEDIEVATMTTITEQIGNGTKKAGTLSSFRSRHEAIGLAMVVLSTVAIAIVPGFAKLAYVGGSNTLTVITTRSIVSVALTWLAMISLGQTVRIARRPMMISLAMGVCYAIMLYGYLGAVAFIPVNLAILINFTHPLFVGLVVAALGDEPISIRMITALTAAVAGLGLAIGVSIDALNIAGISLAVLSTIMCVVVIIGNGRALKQASALAVVFYMMVSAATTLALLFLFFGKFTLPSTTAGWIGFWGVGLGATIGTLAFFCAVPLIGAVRATMITNVEPLLGVMFAVTILGEGISILQATGIALVLSSIVGMELKPTNSTRES